MNNRMIYIIRPIGNAAEKEYIKEFFRFIGCFISDCVVEEKKLSEWDQCLRPNNKENCVDIVLNYYDSDPYSLDCQQHDIKRIYCYFDFGNNTGITSSVPLMPDDVSAMIKPLSQEEMRKGMLVDLIKQIWDNESADFHNVLSIANMYVNNSQGDLFYLLQAKRCLRVLGMGEVLKEPSAQISRIPLSPYIKRIITGLLEMQVQLQANQDVHSVYAQVNAAGMIHEIVCKLYNSDYSMLKTISFGSERFRLYATEELIQKLRSLIEANPEFVSASLLMASLCGSSTGFEQVEESYYHQTLKSVHNDEKGYAFIWYRIGYFFEKKYCDTDQALEYYQKAIQADPQFYQALFKLGYYAAADGRFNEAEVMLNQLIQIIFHGRSTDPNENGEYNNWLSLSLKDSQYVYKAYILLAKIAINLDREYSAKAFIGKACLAATRFEEAGLVQHVSDPDEEDFKSFMLYHKTSTPVWAMWQVLRPWSEDIIQDFFVKNIVFDRLTRWK